jgi:hypothetical protein
MTAAPDQAEAAAHYEEIIRRIIGALRTNSRRETGKTSRTKSPNTRLQQEPDGPEIDMEENLRTGHGRTICKVDVMISPAV